jgi:hypothetical protein
MQPTIGIEPSLERWPGWPIRPEQDLEATPSPTDVADWVCPKGGDGAMTTDLMGLQLCEENGNALPIGDSSNGLTQKARHGYNFHLW